MAVSDYDKTPGNNVSISGINIAEGCSPAGINNAIRQIMADVKTLVDISTEQTDVASGDLMYVTKAGVTAKVTFANMATDTFPHIQAQADAVYVNLTGDTMTGDLAAPAFIGKYNPKYHGAVGDGTTDDSTAVGDAVDYALDNSGCVDLPVGKFLMNSAVDRTLTGDARKFGIVGQGQGSSEFIIPATNTDGGILIDVQGTSDRSDQALFRDFSMETRAVGGIGLRFRQSPGGVQELNTVIAKNVRLWTETTGSDYFAQAFDFSGAWRPLIDGCFWAGPVDGYDHTDADPALGCTYALNLEDCYDPIISNSWFKGAKYGIYLHDVRGGNESEAARITDCVMNQVNYGIWWERSTREPLLMIDRTHINYKIRGMHIDGAKLGHITNCLIYNEDSGEEFAGNPSDIYLVNAAEMMVTNNTFHQDGHTGRKGIQVLSTGEVGAGHNNQIYQNMFAGMFDVAIEFQSGADDNTGSGNSYPGTVTTQIADSGTGNSVT